jgi:hypothetical protein
MLLEAYEGKSAARTNAGISTGFVFTYSPVSLTAPPAGQTIDSTALGF